jgi:hypothetical protein
MRHAINFHADVGAAGAAVGGGAAPVFHRRSKARPACQNRRWGRRRCRFWQGSRRQSGVAGWITRFFG